MEKEIEMLLEDLRDFNLPVDFETAYEKVKCSLDFGDRVYWYYADDMAYFEDVGVDVKDSLEDIYSGLVIPRIGVSSRRELEVDDAIIVIDWYPTEKEQPEIAWVALKRLVNDKDLVELFQKTT